MKSIYLVLLFLCLSIGGGLRADTPKYAVTLDGLYLKPIGSSGYSVRGSSGWEGKLGLEWRLNHWAAIGLEGHYDQIDTSQYKSIFNGGALTFRWIPVTDLTFESYVLLGAGWDTYERTDLKVQDKSTGFVGQLGMGVILPITRAWAMEFGADYAARPAVNLLNTVGGRAGLQYRFDSFFGYGAKAEPTPVVEEHKLREIHSKVRMNGKEMSLSSQSHMEDSDIKGWKLEVRSKDGTLLKTLEGSGPVPKDLDLGDLKDRAGLTYSLKLRDAKGGQENNASLLEEQATRAEGSVAPVESVVTDPDDTLWGIAGRPEVYGDPFLYFLIFDANTKVLGDPDVVPSGVKLTIPRNVTAKQKHNALIKAWNRSESKAAAAEEKSAGQL